MNLNITGYGKEALDCLGDVGIKNDVKELMDFNCLNNESWEYIVVYFRVSLVAYYRSRYSREELREIGFTDGAVSTLKDRAKSVGMNYDISTHPYILAYIKRFQHLGYRNTLRKFKRDFIFWAFRTSEYSRPNVQKKFKLTEHPVRKYLNEALRNDS